MAELRLMAGARDGQLRIRRGEDSPPWALQVFDDELGLWLTLAQADTRTDSFTRPNQTAWGTASDGHIWSKVYDGGADDGIIDHRATLSTGDSFDTSNWLLGPALRTDDVELLVRWRQDTGLTSDHIALHARADDTDSSQVEVQVSLDGTVNVFAGGSSTPESWGGTALMQDIWTRVRIIGTTINVRVWLAGDNEPTSWTATATQTSTIAGRYVAVSLGTGSAHAASVSLGAFRAAAIGPMA